MQNDWSARGWKARLGGVVVALLIAQASLFIFTRGNRFPVNYHPDEQGKAQQLSDPAQSRNFNQPLLMLESAQIVRKVFGVPNDIRSIVLAGRWTSALLAAIAVLALALAGGGRYGWRGVLLCGLMIGLCPPLLVYAHYFKEDTALIAGIAIAILGARWLVDARQISRQIGAAVVLGAGCAAAISGKYVGLVVIVPCLVAIAIAPIARWWALPLRGAVFLAAMSLFVLLVNARAFQRLVPPRLSAAAYQTMKIEFAHGQTGHDFLALNTPNLYCLRVACDDLLPHVWVFLVIGFIGVILNRTITRWGITLGVFVAVLAVALSFDAIPFARYALPLSVLLYFAAAAMCCYLFIGRGMGNVAMVACAAAVILFQGARCVNFTDQFRDDSRQRLRDWMAVHVPSGSNIAADRYIALDGDAQPVLQIHVANSALAADVAPTLDQLADQGVEYVAVADSNYERFLDPRVHGLFPREYEMVRRRRFYEDLFAHGQLIWSSAPLPPTHAYVNPELRLYRISAGYGTAGSVAAPSWRPTALSTISSNMIVPGVR